MACNRSVGPLSCGLYEKIGRKSRTATLQNWFDGCLADLRPSARGARDANCWNRRLLPGWLYRRGVTAIVSCASPGYCHPGALVRQCQPSQNPTEPVSRAFRGFPVSRPERWAAVQYRMNQGKMLECNFFKFYEGITCVRGRLTAPVGRPGRIFCRHARIRLQNTLELRQISG